MKFENLTVGFAVTGSFCTLKKTVAHIRDLTENGADVIPIMSEITYNTDTRFGKAEDFISEIKSITGNEIITSIKGAEKYSGRFNHCAVHGKHAFKNRARYDRLVRCNGGKGKFKKRKSACHCGVHK